MPVLVPVAQRRYAERVLQARLPGVWHHGEWFRLSPDDFLHLIAEWYRHVSAT